MTMEAWNTTAGVWQWAEAVRKGLEALSPEERREVLRLLLECGTIDGEDQVCIVLSIPIQTGGRLEDVAGESVPFVIPPEVASPDLRR